jgi:hypothetical protein
MCTTFHFFFQEDVASTLCWKRQVEQLHCSACALTYEHLMPAPPPAPASQALASAGVASRRNCIDLVKQGRVRVNGAIITDPATRVEPAADVLEVAGKGRLQLAAPGGPEVRTERTASSNRMVTRTRTQHMHPQRQRCKWTASSALDGCLSAGCSACICSVRGTRGRPAAIAWCLNAGYRVHSTHLPSCNSSQHWQA